MASSPAFVLSAGVQLQLTETGLSLRHDGDVVLEQSLGRALESIEVSGDLTIRLPRITGTIVAGGTLRLEGAIDAESIRGARVEIGSQPVKCKAISATESIVIGPATLQVDAIQAPEVRVEPAASGRVTVIECHNERPATKIKGGFSLTDYEDMFGDAAGFLASRGLSPLQAGKVAAPRPAPIKAAAATRPAPTPPPPVPSPVIAPPALDDEAELAPTGAVPSDEDEEVDDPLSLSLDDLEPLVESGGNDAGELRLRLNEALKRITACYEGQDLPPAVGELRALVEDGDMEALASNITEVWNGLLGFHQKRGIRPHHQVTHAFNVIHSLVQR